MACSRVLLWTCATPWANIQTSCTGDRKSTRLNSSHLVISYAVFCLKKKKEHIIAPPILQAAAARTLVSALAPAVQLDALKDSQILFAHHRLADHHTILTLVPQLRT